MRKRSSLQSGVIEQDLLIYMRTGKIPDNYKEPDVKKQITRPQASDPRNMVLKATVYSESEKALHLKVELDASKYTVKFPYKPHLYIWTPKKLTHRMNTDYFEVPEYIARQNLFKSLLYLKKKLSSDFAINTDQIQEVYLL